MVQEYVAFGKWDTQKPGRLSAKGLFGCAAVDKIEVPLLDNGKYLIHLGIQSGHPGAHMIVDPLYVGDIIQIFF